MKIHPVAEKFPMMGTDELNDLAADIKTNGLLHPIVIWIDAEGELDKKGEEYLVDGRNRQAACKIIGMKPLISKLENGHDPTAFILSMNIARRHMSKGQQAMAVAMIYPEPEKPVGRGGRKDLKIKPISLVNAGLLSQARTVLATLPEDAKQILAGTKNLGDTYKEAITHSKNLESEETRRTQLQSAAPDLAELVNEERMSFSEAWAAFENRKTELEAAEENKRETFLRVTEQAYRAVVAWASLEFETEISQRLEDKEFRQKFADRVRFNTDEIKLIERGAKNLTAVLKRQFKKERRP